MSKTEPKQVICELKNGDKVEGILSIIDKQNLKIKLTSAKKTTAENPSKTETFEELELNKDEIKELKLIQFEPRTEPKEQQQNINAIPEDKKPVMAQNQAKTKSYDKSESFFDNLKGMTHPEARQESKNYNDKNKDTFNLTEQEKRQYFNKNNHGNRGGFHQRGSRGRGRGGRGGYNQNYHHNNYNNNYGNRRGRGGNRGRGGYNNWNRGGFNQNFNQNNNNNNNNFQQKHPNAEKLTPYQPEGGVQVGMEKSIYDN